MRQLLPVVLAISCCIGCDRASNAGAPATSDEPTCERVVERADQLAIDWAARDSPHKAETLRKVIEKERGQGDSDPAVELCEERLTARQKRCVMAADDLVEKNDCLKEDE